MPYLRFESVIDCRDEMSAGTYKPRMRAGAGVLLSLTGIAPELFRKLMFSTA